MIKDLSTEITKLKNQLLFLGTEVEDNLRQAEKALCGCDRQKAKDVIAKDEDIDRTEIEVEEKCMQILAQHQPVAGDLRLVITVLKINNELERIGDLAVKIADRVLLLTGTEHCRMEINALAVNDDFRGMFRDAIKLVKKCLDAFINEDADLAYQVCLWDDEVDEAKSHIRSHIEEMASKEPEKHPYLAMLMSVSRSLERIADHATNVAKDVIYMLQGKIVRHDIE